MIITKNNFFIGILAFIILVNILVLGNINQFYIRAILSFIFIITIPGLLIMLMLKIRTIGFWEYLVYTIGLSVAFIMFAGLAVNWILPWLDITDKPLSLWPIIICFDIFLLIMGYFAYKRNKTLRTFQFHFPKLDTTNQIFFIIPMIFPVLSVLGAFLLNNHGPNTLTMIMLGGIAVYVFCVVLFREKLNGDVIYPWALWMIGLSLLLSYSMRSWYVSGPDISLEYWVFTLAKENAYWSLSNFNHAYNAMLSLNIFPTIISCFINVNNQFIFKLFFPIVFSVISLMIYLISRKRLFALFCFFAGLLFLSSQDFVNCYPIPIRQQIAFLFFGLMLLVLFTKNLEKNIKKMFFIIFGFSMIVSHYSTSYITLVIFLLTYVCIFIYKRYENHKIKKGRLFHGQKQEFHLNGVLILLLLVFGFLWYSQLSTLSEGPIIFMKKSLDNLGNIFDEDVRQGSSTDPIFGFFRKPQVGNFIEEYKNKMLEYDLSNKTEGFSKEKYYQYQIRHKPSNRLDSKIRLINILMLAYYSKQTISKIFQLFILFGLLYIIKNKEIEGDLKNFFIGTSFVVAVFLILPFFSIDYSLTRFIQQTLIILSSLSILGGKVFFDKTNIKPPIVLSILLIIFFLLFSGFISQLFLVDEAKAQLNNLGKDYDMYYMFNQDAIGAGWLNENKGNFMVYADICSRLKINSYAGKLNSININGNLIPSTISKQDYVYLSTINNIKNMGFFSVKGLIISYNFPTEFLNKNKNKIYSNGGSEIFK